MIYPQSIGTKENGRSIKRPNSQSTSPVILEPSAEVIKAFATVKRIINRDKSRQWSLTIRRCPYCGDTHVHGGGDSLRPLLGHRASHCLDDNPGYLLVDVEGCAA